MESGEDVVRDTKKDTSAQQLLMTGLYLPAGSVMRWFGEFALLDNHYLALLKFDKAGANNAWLRLLIADGK